MRLEGWSHEHAFHYDRQSQLSDPSRPVSRRRGIRGGRHLSGLAGSAGTDRRRHRVAAAGGV